MSSCAGIDEPTRSEQDSNCSERTAVGSCGVATFALAVLGSGSGNVSIPDHLGDGQVALIERGSFGGTCINRGCIPTKMFSYTADLALQVRRAHQFGLSATLEKVDWPAIRDRIIARIDETSSSGRRGVPSPRVSSSSTVTVRFAWSRTSW